ncbi:MAG: hypothetical protein EHM42_07615, partial [Planctomycetaceae bacterium]
MRASWILPCLVLLALSIRPAETRAQSTLIFNLRAGERFLYELTTDIDQQASQSAGNKVIKENSIQVMTVETTIDKVSDQGVADVKQKIIRLKMAMDVPAPGEGRIEYDSNSPTDSNDVPTKRLMQFGSQMVGQ